MSPVTMPSEMISRLLASEDATSRFEIDDS